LKAHFSIVQKNKEILEVICLFLVYYSRINSNIPFFHNLVRASFTLPKIYLKKKDKINSVYSFDISNQDTIYQVVAPFFASKQFLTRKGYDLYI